MKLTLEAVVAAPRGTVFAALADAALIQRCLAGCEELTLTDPDTFRARLKVGLAAFSGTYTGTASIRDRQPPERLTMAFDGKGAPGFVRGSAAINLAQEGPHTRVHCDADVLVGGVIAAVGSRLVAAAARKMADDFFRQLSNALAV